MLVNRHQFIELFSLDFKLLVQDICIVTYVDMYHVARTQTLNKLGTGGSHQFDYGGNYSVFLSVPFRFNELARQFI